MIGARGVVRAAHTPEGSNMKHAVLVALGLACSDAFTAPLVPVRAWGRPPSRGDSLRMSRTSELPSQAARQEAIYDMVYVERLPEAQQLSSGFLLPTKAEPRMHVCKVISMGHGWEGESGNVVPSLGIAPGDLVYVKDPFGIGPHDDEFAGQKFSFVKYQSICAVLPGDNQAFEDSAREAGAAEEEIGLVL